jgi:quercetin dioxygenase-like cupin family protein
MRTINRRDVLSLIASSSGALAFAQAADPGLDQSQVFTLEKLKVVSQQDGWETRPSVHGKLPDGEALDVHHSVLPAGHMPHAPHQHKHAELMILLDGEIDFYDKGITKHMESGDMALAAPGQLHGWKNVGKTPARYYVIAIGSDT